MASRISAWKAPLFFIAWASFWDLLETHTSTAEANSHVFATPGSQEPCLHRRAEHNTFLQYLQTFAMQRGGVESSELHLKLRTELRTVNFADAHVEAWHEAPEDPNSNSNVSGGAFFSEGSFTLTRSRLTATWIVFKFRILSIALVSDMKF